jgi:hypothetical protein
MKASLKRKELRDLHKNLQENLARYVGVKLAYAVAKNVRALKSEVEILDEMEEPSEEFKSFRDKLYASHLKLCLKDEKGMPIPAPGGLFQFETVESRDEAEASEVALREEYQEAITEHEEKMRELDIEIELHAVNIDDLNDNLDGKLVSYLMPFLEE